MMETRIIGALGKMEYSVIAITPRITLVRSSSA